MPKTVTASNFEGTGRRPKKQSVRDFHSDDPDFQYTAKSKKPLYIYISVRDFHSLVKITRFSVIRDFADIIFFSEYW